MSWMQRLYETYESLCAGGSIPNGLIPVGHAAQRAHLEVTIGVDGGFRIARVLDKANGDTVIPVTEKSASRTSGSEPHPLADKLKYVAGDLPANAGGDSGAHALYVDLLGRWSNAEPENQKLAAVRRYIERNSLVADLLASGVLVAIGGEVGAEWSGPKDRSPELYRQVTSLDAALVRWRVEVPGVDDATTWSDTALHASWQRLVAGAGGDPSLCNITGVVHEPATLHPARVRHAADRAKLVSSNDQDGFTYRGRFLDAAQVAVVGSAVTQKAHSALRWLIQKQGFVRDEQAYVAWAGGGAAIPSPIFDGLELLGLSVAQGGGSVATEYALRVRKAIAGYRANLAGGEGVSIIGLDSASPGRLAVIFYRELPGSEFLSRIEDWHERCAWRQDLAPVGAKGERPRRRQFTGAPSPSDIARAHAGRNDKVRKATVEALLPCVVDGAPIPLGIVEGLVRRAANYVGIDGAKRNERQRNWNEMMGIACAVYRHSKKERNYAMSLEEGRASRDYLYGRLLAVADHLESMALYLAGEERDTTAMRYMQRFASNPYQTWRVIELALKPYESRLRSRGSGGLLHKMRKLLDEIVAKFQVGTFENAAPLSGEFLLGFHCQRHALRPAEKNVTQESGEKHAE